MLLRPRNLISVFSAIILLSCHKGNTIEENIETKVYGRIYDEVNKLPIANMKLVISESINDSRHFIGNWPTFIQNLDSTFTDEDGFYEMNFITSGRGDTYFISQEEVDSVWTYFQNSIEIFDLGSEVQVKYNFLTLFPTTLKITIENDVQFLPISFFHLYSDFSINLNEIKQTGVELTRNTFIDKNSPQKYDFVRTTPDGVYQRATIIVPETYTTNKTEFELIVSDSDFKNQ